MLELGHAARKLRNTHTYTYICTSSRLRIVFQKFLSAKQLGAVEMGGIRWFAWGNHGKEAFFGDVAEFRCPKRRRKSESFGVPIFASSIRESVEILEFLQQGPKRLNVTLFVIINTHLKN
jgi:hypothetical protein